jgi:uncharacterized protein (TIGR00369 family)
MPDLSISAAQELFNALPHAKALGMRFVSSAKGEVTMELPYDERFIGDPATGVIHGGAVFALLDTCSGAAVYAHPDHKGVTATIDLRVDYMRPAAPGQTIRATATCYNMTRTVAFVRAVATDVRDDKPVAMASGTFVTGV